MSQPFPVLGPRRRAVPLVTAAALLLLSAALAPQALAEDTVNERPEREFELTEQVIEDSITRFTVEESITRFSAEDSIIRFTPESSITVLGESEQEEDGLIVLETDILFASNEWELPTGAPDRLADLVADVPQGAMLQVTGHTDSRPVDQSRFDFDNQQLSENRAQAVADALAEVRPDLELEVSGLGDTSPAVTEDPEDSSTAASNRRVELRYGDAEG